MVGPDWFVEAARDLAPDDLARVSTLLTLAEGHGGADPLGVGVLAFTDEHVDLPGLDEAEIGDEAALVARLRESARRPTSRSRRCSSSTPPSCWSRTTSPSPVRATPVGRPARPRRRGDRDRPPPPRTRLLAAAAATNDALASGLVAQWRARHDNEASLRLARRLGYTSSAPRPGGAARELAVQGSGVTKTTTAIAITVSKVRKNAQR